MGQFFSDAVERALRYIYYEPAGGQGTEGLQLLEQASAAGDGDASCVLARCLFGSEYVWEGHGFPEDERRGDALIRRSVQQGSALGVLIALRCGEMDAALEQSMPFENLEEAFRIVLDKAERGEPFCQYVIANVYFWWDFIRIQRKGREDFPDDQTFREYLAQNVSRCEEWYWRAFRNGTYLGGANLYMFYKNGEEGLIPPQPERAKEINRFGAERGYPMYEYQYGRELWKEGRREEAFPWLKKATEHGELRACFYAGLAFEWGKGVEKDAARAAEYYEKGMAASENREGCCNRLGALYFNGEGVPIDYARAFQLLKWADDQGNTGNWGAYYLGACYAYGRGVQQDFVRARAYLEKVDWDCPDAFALLGWMYAWGKGGPESIQAGVEMLQKAGNHPQAKEELKRYKKTLFGKWVRR